MNRLTKLCFFLLCCSTFCSCASYSVSLDKNEVPNAAFSEGTEPEVTVLSYAWGIWKRPQNLSIPSSDAVQTADGTLEKMTTKKGVVKIKGEDGKWRKVVPTVCPSKCIYGVNIKKNAADAFITIFSFGIVSRVHISYNCCKNVETPGGPTD